MSNFEMPSVVNSLPNEQQKAISSVLKASGLLTESGERVNFSIQNMPQHHKEFLDASLRAAGQLEPKAELFDFNPGCIAARIAEGAAVAACATVPGGQIAIAACVAAAHALANEACK